MTIQERIEKMLKKTEPILQAGRKDKPEQLKPCEICGAETNNAFKTSVDWVTHNVCDNCAQIKGDELSTLDKNKRFAILAAKILADDTNDD